MFNYIQEIIYKILIFYINNPHLYLCPKDFWSLIALEWLTLQIIFLYTYTKLINSKNYFKQILTLMWLLCILAIYLAFMQLELFACFMFIAEFTIVIFFYTLFLHLRISTSVTNNSNDTVFWSNSIFLTLFTIIILGGFTYLNEVNSNILFSELYKRVNYIAFSDLAFFAATILRTNVIIHFLVGLLLLFLTLFLFFTTNIYYFLNISKQDTIKLTASKLAVSRGYYEQTAEEVQKIISNKHTKL